MDQKIKTRKHTHFIHKSGNSGNGQFFRNWKKIAAVISVIAVIAVTGGIYPPANKVQAAGIDTITTALVTSAAASAESQITITFSPTTAITSGDVISIYLGDNTGGGFFVDTDATVDGTDVTCVQAGATFGSYTQTEATASTPLWASCTVTGGGDTSSLVMTIGDGVGDDLYNPATADIYTTAVVTDDDSGAGLIYVGDANDVYVSTTVLSNLSLLLDGADGVNCTGTPVVTCDLGVALTTTVNTGSYDVNAGSNSSGNITISIAEDGDLGTIDDVVNDTVVAADGTEEYGVSVSDDGAEWTPAGNYAANDTPIVAGPTAFYTSTGPASEAGDDITVTHKVNISTATAAGVHSHTVTYTAAADF